MLDLEKLRICVHCGLCLEDCPTYRLSKNEADSPRGRILLMRGVLEGRISMTESVFQHLDGCLDCRACETVCPAGVPYGELIEEGRSELYPKIPEHFNRQLIRILLTYVLPNRFLLKGLKLGLLIYQRSGLQSFVRKSGVLKFFPSWLETGEKLFPKIDNIPEINPNFFGVESKSSVRVALFRGCIASVLFPEVERATIRIFESLGYEVSVPPTQTCCGALLLHAGFKDDASLLARKNIEAFVNDRCRSIVVTAAGCGSALKSYGTLIEEDSKADQFSMQISDVSEFLAKQLPNFQDKLRSLRLRVTYQDACHLAHAQKIRSQPRLLLEKIPDLQLVEFPHSDWCCGSAGIYNLTHSEDSSLLLKDKIEAILSVQPDVVAVGNPGCALQIKMGLLKVGSSIQVKHPVELLYESLFQFDSPG